MGWCPQDALTSNRYQLVLAMKCKDSAAAASALTCLGHVYTVITRVIAAGYTVINWGNVYTVIRFTYVTLND
jgi:hypothetical protein